MHAQAGVQPCLSADTCLSYFTQRNKVKVRIQGMRKSQAQKTFGTVYTHIQKYNPRPPSKQVSCGAEGTSTLKNQKQLARGGLQTACSRGTFPFSGPPATLWEPSGEKQGFPAPMHSQLLRLKAERRSGTGSVAIALLPQANKRLVLKGMALHRKK